MSQKPRIVVVMDGGLIQSVISNMAADILVIDYDTEGITEPLSSIPQRNGSTEPAVTQFFHPSANDNRTVERIDQLFNAAEQ